MSTAGDQSAFAHFILMRFNVRTKHAAEPRDAAIRGRKDWLESRFKLFEEFCWPTLAAQSSKAFKLFVFFDQDTPANFLDRFEAITAGSNFVEVVLCDFFDANLARRNVISSLTANHAWVLTTRLDNDDGLHQDFVQTLQSLVLPHVEAINFPRGLVLTGRSIYLSHQRSNAFISLFEDVRDCKTVLQVSHNQVELRFAIRDIVTCPMWFQHVHGGNVSNKVRGRRIPSAQIPTGFEALNLTSRIKKSGWLQAAAENATFGVLRAGRDRFAKTLRRLKVR